MLDAAEPAVLEVICDHQSAAGPTVTHVRGTMIVSSLQVLKELGHFERYVTLLPAEQRDQVLYTLALSWCPLELATTHYRACDALALSPAELTRMGELVGENNAHSFFGTLLRTARLAGVEGPWIALRSQATIWDRIYRGGGARVFRTGLKDAVVELHGLPLVSFRYFRVAYASYVRGLAAQVVKKIYITQVATRGTQAHALTLRGSWV